MLKIIALDPELFAEWDHHAALRDKFGVSRGRLIAKFPNHWKGLLQKRCAALVQAGTLGPVKAKAIENWMTPSHGQVQRDTRFFEGAWPYHDSMLWPTNAEAQAERFDCVLSAHSLEATNALHADEAHAYLDDPRFEAHTQRMVRRQKEDLVNCVWPLLCVSREVKIVEPHFDPVEPRFKDTLVHLCDRLHNELPKLNHVELHVKRSAEFCEATFNNYRQQLEHLLFSGFKLTVYFWASKRQELHPRFLLTDCCLLQFDYGWDNGRLAGAETLAALLSDDIRKQEWQRYSVGSEDFDLDPGNHVLMLGG